MAISSLYWTLGEQEKRGIKEKNFYSTATHMHCYVVRGDSVIKILQLKQPAGTNKLKPLQWIQSILSQQERTGQEHNLSQRWHTSKTWTKTKLWNDCEVLWSRLTPRGQSLATPDQRETATWWYSMFYSDRPLPAWNQSSVAFQDLIPLWHPIWILHEVQQCGGF